MKDILTDIIEHTHALGFLDTLKINGTTTETNIVSVPEDRSVVMYGKTVNPVIEFEGKFGMPRLAQLNILLKIPEYKENAKLTLSRNNDNEPVGIHFENEHGDFQNDYRFMSGIQIDEKMKTPTFKGLPWAIELEPTLNSITRFGFQASANSDQPVFEVKTEENNLIFQFGNHSSHAGQFVFADITGTGKLNKKWTYPVQQFSKIMNLTGDKKLQVSNGGAMKITVHSGLVEYTYFILGQAII